MSDPKHCKHEDAYWDDDGFSVESAMWCPECKRYVLFTCPACHGEGSVIEADYECDWINYGDDLITCPECRGTGKVKELTWY